MDPEDVKDFVLEKLKEFWLLLWNFGVLVVAKIDEIFPPGTREEKFQRWFKAALPYLIIGAPLLLCCYCCCCRRGRSSSGRTMKAPGRDYRISRSRFESNPRSYFQDLRGKTNTNAWGPELV